MITVPIKRLYADAILPTYAHVGDAGADLYAYEDVALHRGEHKLVSTGIAVAIPQGYVGLVHPRSGMAANYGVTVLNAPGTIDSGYRGEIRVNLINLGSLHRGLRKGDRIAQLVLQEVSKASFEEVIEFDQTDRGENGHGSTGGFYGLPKE